jgi:hypothetical protein
MPSYKITSIRVEIRPGVFITAEVSNVEDVKHVLEDLKKVDLLAEDETARARRSQKHQPSPPASTEDDSPEARLAGRASIPVATLHAAKILAFKDGVPQLFRPGMFASVSDATLSLMYAAEIGLKKSSIAYEDFKALYEAQNIKSGSPLPMLLSNLHNGGYIDKKAYSTDRTVRLTAKGEKKAEEVLKSLCGQKS